MQEAVCTAGELFLAAHKGFQRQAALPARAKDEGLTVGELLFDKLPGADGSADEASAWEVRFWGPKTGLPIMRAVCLASRPVQRVSTSSFSMMVVDL